MTWLPLMAFAAIAVVFGIGEYLSSKTKGMVSSIIIAIVLFLLLGGTFKLLPPDLMPVSGLVQLIPTFGMGLILVNVGSMLDLNDLKTEWKTVVVSLAGVIGIIAVDFTLGAAIFGREFALTASAPTAGGMVATMMLTEAANNANRPDLASFVAAVMGLQMIIGVPIASFCLRKEALAFVKDGRYRVSETAAAKRRNFRLLPPTPKALDLSTLHFARLAIVAVLAQLCTKYTGISTGVTFLVFGMVFGAIGFVERGSLKTAGGEGILMLATYASITASFVSMTLAQFGKLLIPVFGMLVLGATGVIIFGVIAGHFLKWSPWLSIAVGVCCLFGYPVTQVIAMEVANGVTVDGTFTPAEIQRVVDHLLPKMLIAGVVSVSIASVVLAGAIIPMVFQ